MPDLKELYAQIEKTEGGAEIVKGLQGIIKGLNDEAATRRVERNAEAEKAKADREKIAKLLELEEGADLEGTLAELKEIKKSGIKPDKLTALQKQIDKLTKQIEEKEKATALERQKRIDTLKANKAISALTDKAVRPEEIANLVMPKIVVKDDDSVEFVDGENSYSVEEGVTKWLEARPEFMKSKSQPGSGGGALPGGAGQDLDKLSIDEFIAKREKEKNKK